MKTLKLFLLFGVTVSCGLTSVVAQDGIWDRELKTSANVSFNQTDKVVGKVDGTSASLGYDLKFALDYVASEWSWKNSLSAVAQFTRSPSVSEFTKASDELKAETAFLYFLNRSPSYGPYASASVRSSLFKGKDVQSATSNYLISKKDGTTQNSSGTSLDLTDSFKPITFTQSFGLFYFPIETKPSTAEFRLGASAREVFAKGQLVVSDDAATANLIEVSELRNFQQLGAEALAKWYGTLKNDNLAYELQGNWMLPLIKGNESGDNRNSLKLLNQNYTAKLEMKFTDWVSASYQFSGVKEPQLVDDFQISNGIFINFSRIFIARNQDPV